MAIILVGSTGSGKTSLGNFLLDPSENHIFDNPTFPTSKDNLPDTKVVKVASKDGITVIDTPGLNEGEYEDLEHMKDIVKTMKNQQSILACILCVEFEAKIDLQYKATVACYKRHLRRLFESKVLIVFTNYSTDKDAVLRRQRRRINKEAIIENARKVINEGLGLSREPKHFLIDSLPYGSEDRSEHEKTRSYILSHIRRSRTAPMNVLLIGSTGSGKSTLGNFLLDPSNEHIFDNPTFQPASTNMPETKEVISLSKGNITVVDTPGLNEDDSKDLEHMIAIVKQLNELKSISACVLCTQYEAKIDAQYKATVAYYKKLLPRLFHNNVLIVFTNYRTDPRTVFMRQRQGLKDKSINNARDEISKGLNYRPAYFQMDSLPFGSEERSYHEEVRLSILDYIGREMKDVDLRVEKLLVAKTPAVKDMERKIIDRAKGEVKGYKEMVYAKRSKKDAILEEYRQKQTEKDNVSQKANNLEDKLKELDSDMLVIDKVWCLEEKWKSLRTQSKQFRVESEWPIADYLMWDNGHVKWTILKQEKYSISGELEGKFMRGLHAKVTLYIHKRDRYAEDIQNIRSALSDKQRISTLLHQKIEILMEKHDSHAADIERCEEQICRFEDEIKEAERDTMTVEEAEEMLKNLRIS